MRSKKSVGYLFLLLFCTSSVNAQFDLDPEVFYLKAEKTQILKAKSATPVYANRQLQPFVKSFIQGEELELMAYHPKALLVKNTRTGYEGWVEPSYVSDVDPQWISRLKAEAEEAKIFDEAIKDEEVLPGMSFEHVQKALGKPTNKTFRSDEKGRLDIWAYVDFERRTEYRQAVDPATRQLVNVAYVVKVQVGSLNVEFKNGRVSALERTRDPSARTKDKFR
jgi:hypothetical protein